MTAAAWWGLRARSRSSRGMKCCRIRRTSDNAELDFRTLDSGALDADAVKTFLTNTSGRIVTLYDQSGNARDVTQGTSANQPEVQRNLAPVLLLHMDGADASTTFTDSSANPITMTPSGNAQIDTAQSVFGGSAALFDGTGDYVRSASSTDLAFGASDFTLDYRVRFSAGGVHDVVDMRNVGSGTGGIAFYMNSDNTFTLDCGAFGSRSTAALSTSTWYHVAVTRSGGTTRLFLDGTKVGSDLSDNNDYTNTIITIGADRNGGNGFAGWIDELRVIKGSAAWTANFTPPTSAYGAAAGNIEAVFTGASSHNLIAGAQTFSQPFTWQHVSNSTATGAEQTIHGFRSASGLTGFRPSAANTATSYAGTHLPATAADGSFHSIASVLNNTSSDTNVDGVATTGSAGALAPSATIMEMGMWNGTNYFTGKWLEGGFWNVAFSGTQSSNVSANQHAYWGF